MGVGVGAAGCGRLKLCADGCMKIKQLGRDCRHIAKNGLLAMGKERRVVLNP